jgi:hypothetical protein
VRYARNLSTSIDVASDLFVLIPNGLLCVSVTLQACVKRTTTTMAQG